MSSTAHPELPGSTDLPVLSAGIAYGVCVLAVLQLGHAGGAVARAGVSILLGAGMCWASNTISHIHLHRPVFTNAAANRLFSLYLSLVLTVPQGWWKRRHLAHHGLADWPAGQRRDRPVDIGAVLEVGLVVAELACLAVVFPGQFGTIILPALVVGYGLCALQGREEHVRASAGVDYHGRLYNVLWFNDGYHAAHHRRPSAHWATLSADARAGDITSRWPPILRFTEEVPALWNRGVARLIDGLERASMRFRVARNLQLRWHTRAFLALLPPDVRSEIGDVTVVGGGLFPRTVLALAPILPGARFTIVDRAATNIDCARSFLGRAGLLGRVHFEHGSYDPEHAAPCDLLVVPLALRGDRARFYAHPPAPRVAIHDWIWRRRGQHSAIASVWLAKRINLVGG